MISAIAIEVRRDDLRRTQVVKTDLDVDHITSDGKVVLAIDSFALTSNNITYAAYGTDMSYWSFFPGSEGFGRVPVWGFGTVVASAADGISVGERFYGYFPMASHLVVEPIKASPKRFIDGAAHRAKLSPVYNTYLRVAGDTAAFSAPEAAHMILKPLVMTSFLIADFLADNAFFGARKVLVSSASSKTSLGLGFCLKRLAADGIALTGLTSQSNINFVNAAGVFDRVVPYHLIDTLDPGIPTVYVDMAGDAAVLTRVHHRFGDQLVYSCRVGATHWEGRAGRLDLPGARPQFFFAPAQIEKRLKDWGPGGLDERFGQVWPDMVASFSRWLSVERGSGVAAVEAAYLAALEGRVPPSKGVILSLLPA